MAVSAAANCQTSTVGQPRPTVTRATDILETAPTEVSVGTAAAFRTKSIAAVEKLVRDGLLVRIFALRSGQERPEPEPGLRLDNCDVYLATVHRLVKGGTGMIKLETVSTLDKGWLQLSNSKETVQPGIYYMVFELTGLNPISQDYFRLHKDHVNGYFDTGFKFTILANDPKIQPAELMAKWEGHKQNIGTLRQKLDALKSTLPCYTFEPRRLQALIDLDTPAGDLIACLVPQEAEATSKL